MAVSARVYWDEENSPKAFLLIWASAALLLLLWTLLFYFHVVPSNAPLAPANPGWAHLLGYVLYISLLVCMSLYLNLIINGFWHRNPDALEPDDSESDDLDISPLNLEPPTDEKKTTEPPVLFDQSLLKNPDPVVTRDQIQWKRMLLATCCTATLFVSFAASL